MVCYSEMAGRVSQIWKVRKSGSDKLRTVAIYWGVGVGERRKKHFESDDKRTGKESQKKKEHRGDKPGTSCEKKPAK